MPQLKVCVDTRPPGVSLRASSSRDHALAICGQEPDGRAGLRQRGQLVWEASQSPNLSINQVDPVGALELELVLELELAPVVLGVEAASLVTCPPAVAALINILVLP